MYVSAKPQQYPPGIQAIGATSPGPFPAWLQPVLYLAAGFVLLKWVAPSAFGAKRKS